MSSWILSNSGYGVFEEALTRRWQSEGRTGRLSQEKIAELTGISVNTVPRIKARTQGVHLDTLKTVFVNLGISWKSRYAEPAPLPIDEPPGEAMPVDSPFYIRRRADDEVDSAIRAGVGIIRIEAPRLSGKSSLLARALHRAEETGARVVTSDLQSLCRLDRESLESLVAALSNQLYRSLDCSQRPDEFWDPRDTVSARFTHYMRDVALKECPGRLVWGIDRVDSILDRDCAAELFSLLRSWSGLQAAGADQPWRRLTILLVCSTEARLLIPNPYRSELNVGRQVRMEDFTPEQIADLNRRLSSPLSAEEVLKLHQLVGGHPFLVRLFFYEMKTRAESAEQIAAEAMRFGRAFGEHLDRIYSYLMRTPELVPAVIAAIEGKPSRDRETFNRLRFSGILAGDSADEAKLRCPLYARYFLSRLM